MNLTTAAKLEGVAAKSGAKVFFQMCRLLVGFESPFPYCHPTGPSSSGTEKRSPKRPHNLPEAQATPMSQLLPTPQQTHSQAASQEQPASNREHESGAARAGKPLLRNGLLDRTPSLFFTRLWIVRDEADPQEVEEP